MTTISDRYRLSGYEILVDSITFEGARIRTRQISDTLHSSMVTASFSNGGNHIHSPLAAGDETFISFGKFGFSGFEDVSIDMSLAADEKGSRIHLQNIPIYAMPLVPFYRDIDSDHHDSFFFRNCCSGNVVYGMHGQQDYPKKGVILICSDVVDQNLIPSRIHNIPSHCLHALQSRQALLYIDQSHEGNAFTASFGEAIHEALYSQSIDADLVFFANHTFDYKLHYNTWAARTDRSLRLNILYSHWYADGLFFREPDYFARIGGVEEYLRRQRFRAYSGISRHRRFFSMNYTPRPHRVLLMLKLVAAGQLQQGIVSFAGIGNSDLYKPNFHEMSGADWIRAVGQENLLTHLPTLEALGVMTVDKPFRAGVEGDAIRLASQMSQQPYNDSYFSIVTESEMSSSLRRVTEKIYKPLLRLHPFIVLGNVGSLDILRAEGFKTFEGFIDESYDLCDNTAERVRLIFAEIDRLIALPEPEIARLYRQLWPVLEHNLRRAYQRMTFGIASSKRAILDQLFIKLRSLPL